VEELLEERTLQHAQEAVFAQLLEQHEETLDIPLPGHRTSMNQLGQIRRPAPARGCARA
jgi:hypothetical protein